MRLVEVCNVNDAYAEMINDALSPDRGQRWRKIAPRANLLTLEYHEPVTTVYKYPYERVLFNAIRDANPFFQLFEAIWLLQGRNDVKWISQFTSNIERYSDDGLTFHGGYGERWRRSRIDRDGMMTQDQIEGVIRHLQTRPDSRRAVIAMWDPALDLNSGSVDLPCNTHIYFKVRNDALDMMVCCRSNDAIWGAYGTNAVQFSILQEYIAAHLDYGIGWYRQVSDSFHIYTDNPTWKKHEQIGKVAANNFYRKSYAHFPLIESVTTFDQEMFVWFFDDWFEHVYEEPFFTFVLNPMRRAWQLYKKKAEFYDVVKELDMIIPRDWREATINWMRRRYNR